MKQKLILSAAGLTILVIILAFVIEWWAEGRYWESTDNAYLRSNITVISAKVPGRVEAVNVSENQLVAKDDILFSINKEAFSWPIPRISISSSTVDSASSSAE